MRATVSGWAEVPAVKIWEAGVTVARADGTEAHLSPALSDYARLAEEVEGSILTYYHLIRGPLVQVLPRTHPAAAGPTADSPAGLRAPVDLRALRHEAWLAAPAGEPSRLAVDRLLAAVGVTPPVLSEFEGMATIVSLAARGIGIAILPRLAVAAAERRVTVRDLPLGLDLARDVYAVARTASTRRPSMRYFPESTSAIALQYARCSSTKIRDASVSQVSSSSTGTVACTIIGPESTGSSTKCTVHPENFTPCSSA